MVICSFLKMEQEVQNVADLEEEIKNMKENTIPTTQMRNNSEISQWTHTVRNVVGSVKLAASPHYGLVLETGSGEPPFILPLVLVDSVKHINQWILIVGEKVWISKLMIIFEGFQNFEGYQDLECINAVIMWEDVKLLKQTKNLHKIGCQPNQHQPIEMLKKNCLKDDNDSNNNIRIMVHHVSSAFCINQPPALCLVLISYINKNQVETKLWLVLKAQEVSWKEFLIPNREYLITLPQQSNQFCFDESQKTLKELFPSNCREFEVIFHHQNLFPTLNGCFLPPGSKIYLTCNTQFSQYIYQFVKDTSCLWFSSNEADYADTGLITLYGQVDIIKYDYEVIFKKCYLCIQATARKPSLAKPNFTTTYSWTNPWISKSSLEKDEVIALPTAEDTCGVMNLGVPGHLVQIIKLRDVTTGEEQSVYVKHSFISKCQQFWRLASGMVICITHLNRRCSAKGKYYYITTVLSSLKVLALPTDLCNNECWGVYGLNCSTLSHYQERMWGVLETVNLIKVAITTRCTNCNSVFYSGICSEECSLPIAQSSALAVCWLQIIEDNSRVTMDKVIIKDSLVRELLCIPENIWQMLLKASAEQEMVCFFFNHDLDKNTSSDLNELFRMYCFIPKPHGKFYISVRKMKAFSDNDPVYYCIHLKPIEKNRLKIIGELAEKVSTK